MNGDLRYRNERRNAAALRMPAVSRYNPREAGAMKYVKNLLQTKGREVFSVTPEATVFQAVELMAEKEVGALLVMEERELRGIISERDYARKVILQGKQSKATPVTEIMSPRVQCVTLDTTVDECMAVMTEKRVRHLPVLDEGRVAGVISIGDVVRSLLSEKDLMIEQLERYITGA